MLKFLMFAAVAAGVCCGGSGDDADDPHALGGCGSDVTPTVPDGAGCESACQHVPAYTAGGCMIAGSTNGHCDQTFTLDTGETGCCAYDLPDQVVKFFECE